MTTAVIQQEVSGDAQVEDLLTLLNSWRVPNDTRDPVEELPSWSGDGWAERFALLPTPRQLPALLDVRDGLRESVSGGTTVVLDRLMAELPPRLGIGDRSELTSAPADSGDAAAVAVWLVFQLAADGRLQRLRTCPDCGWAFYDTSRNGRRVWCAMTGKNGGRACGAIAKTRAYRARQLPRSAA